MYTLEEVKKKTLEYFGGDDLASNVWIDKYCLRDKEGNYLEDSPRMMYERLSAEFYKIENKYPNPLTYEEIYELISSQIILPGGSLLYGIGNNYSISSLGNCFVIGNDADSYGGICTTDQEQVQLMKRRAGVGHDISHLRSKGSPTTNSAKTSSGIVPFMERYSNSTREVAQDGRRGALMLSIDIDHPQSEDFITAKDDTTKVTGANISVKVDDAFMQAVELDSFYPLNTNESFIPIKAKDLWNKLVHQAWKSAEPGLLFWDKIKSESIPSCYGKEWEETSTNPCVTGETLILTDNGYYPIIDLVDTEINVWNGKEFSNTVPKITGINQKILKISLSDGRTLKCTPKHTWYTWKGFSKGGISIKKEAKELQVGDKLEKYNFPVVCYGTTVKTSIAYTQGFYSGDGNKNSQTIWLYDEKIKLAPYLEGVLRPSVFITPTGGKRQSFRLTFKNNSKNWVPINEYSIKSRLDWLAGVIDSDGTATIEGGLQIVSVNKKFLSKVQTLLSTLGVNSKICKGSTEGFRTMPNGKGGYKDFYCQEANRILVSAFEMQNLVKLGLNTHRVNFTQYSPNRDASRFVTVVSIEQQEELEDFVYCFTEEKEHKGIFNGILTGQCGEIPLCPYDSCRLLSVNLTKFVDNPFTDKAAFNWDRFKYVVYIAQKLMDDVIDLEEEKINRILNKIENDPEDEKIKAIEKDLWIKIKGKLLEGRRTGLSAIGLADTLAMLGYSYSGGINFAESIYKNFAISAYKSSIDMAKDRGAFPIFDINKEVDLEDGQSLNPFIDRIMNTINEEGEWKVEDYINYGRRNIAILTIPPSGTISLLARISSGIEPVYQLSYKRRRKVDPNHPNISFVDKNGDCWEEYEVFHPKYKEWLDSRVKIMEKYGETPFDNPYHGSTAYELNPIDRVKMQGAIQKWIDHSISSTINLFKNTTEEQVSEIYLEAWKQDLKGITIYRDGSRDGVLYTDSSQKDTKFVTNNAPKRPKILAGEVFTPSIKGNEYIVIVGLFENKPYEVFACKNNWNLKGHHHCDVIKKTKGRYDVNIKDVLYIENITSEMSQIEEDKTRLISVSLRHGADIQFLVEQLNKAKSNGFQDFSKIVARTLKKYIKENAEVTGATCPNCGSKLKYVDGCESCLSDCGYSKC